MKKIGVFDKENEYKVRAPALKNVKLVWILED